MNSVRIWVQPHDDPAVRFVVNTLNEMEENFGDLIDEANSDSETIKVYWPGDSEPTHYDASRVLRLADPNTWRIRLGWYLDTWTEMEMPTELFLSDDEEGKLAFIEAHIND